MRPIITPACAYHFTACHGYKAAGYFAALCGCGKWACYQTTEELSRPKWEAHAAQVNGASE